MAERVRVIKTVSREEQKYSTGSEGDKVQKEGERGASSIVSFTPQMTKKVSAGPSTRQELHQFCFSQGAEQS